MVYYKSTGAPSLYMAVPSQVGAARFTPLPNPIQPRPQVVVQVLDLSFTNFDGTSGHFVCKRGDSPTSSSA